MDSENKVLYKGCDQPDARYAWIARFYLKPETQGVVFTVEQAVSLTTFDREKRKRLWLTQSQLSGKY